MAADLTSYQTPNSSPKGLRLMTCLSQTGSLSGPSNHQRVELRVMRSLIFMQTGFRQ